jgi:hypothetical protein
MIEINFLCTLVLLSPPRVTSVTDFAKNSIQNQPRLNRPKTNTVVRLLVLPIRPLRTGTAFFVPNALVLAKPEDEAQVRASLLGQLLGQRFLVEKAGRLIAI